MRIFASLLLPAALCACTSQDDDEHAIFSGESALTVSGVNAELRVQSDWGSGYCADVTLRNESAAPVTSWSAVVELNQSTLSQIWNATARQSGSRLTVQPTGNGRLAPGASINAFGFCSNRAGSNYRPALVSISIVGGAGSGSTDAGSADAGSASGGTDAGSASGGGSGLSATCSGPCNAATPVAPTLQSGGGSGNVTMYSTSASSGGACNYGATGVLSYAAINVNVQAGDGKGQWQGGRICGQCAQVNLLTSRGPKSVVVRIMDKCPDGHCGIDLGGSAPAAVMLDGSGRYQGQWTFVPCGSHPGVSDGAPSLTVVSGSNAWWSRVRVRNPAAAVTAIDWSSGTASGPFPYATDPENAFEVPVNQVLQSQSTPFRITVRYAGGGTASVQLSPSQLAAGGSSYPLM